MSADGGSAKVNILYIAITASISAATSWYFTKKYIERVYDDRLALQIEETRAFYLDLYQGGDASEENSEAVTTVEKAVEAVRKYDAKSDDFVPTDYTKFSKAAVIPVVTPPTDEVEESDESVQIPASVTKTPGPRAPYMIDEATFNDPEVGYDQASLAYYVGDDVLANEEDGTLFKDYDDTIGIDNIRFLRDKNPGDPNDDHPHTIYVRSESFTTDFEITRMMEKYYDKDKLLPPSSGNT